jgi:hypothetical protein
MAVNKVTLVSALFDIGRDSWSNYRMAISTYVHWMRNTLALDANFIVFVDERTEEPIWKTVEELGAITRVRLIRCKLESLLAYQMFFHEMKGLMESEDFKRHVAFQVPEMVQPLYNVLMFNKLNFMQVAMEQERSDYVIWVDAGGLREDISNYRGFAWPDISKIRALPQDKLTCFSHHGQIRIQSAFSHAMSQMRYIQGTSIFCPSAILDQVCCTFDDKVIQCLNGRFIGSDEKILDLMCVDNPSLFHLIVCGWRQYYQLFK